MSLRCPRPDRVKFLAQRAALFHQVIIHLQAEKKALRLARYYGMSEGFFLGLQMDYDLMEQRRALGKKLNAIRPRAA